MRSGDLVKILWHDGVGISLYAKRLERSRFQWPVTSGGAVSISSGAARLPARGEPMGGLLPLLHRGQTHPVRSGLVLFRTLFDCGFGGLFRSIGTVISRTVQSLPGVEGGVGRPRPFPRLIVIAAEVSSRSPRRGHFRLEPLGMGGTGNREPRGGRGLFGAVRGDAVAALCVVPDAALGVGADPGGEPRRQTDAPLRQSHQVRNDLSDPFGRHSSMSRSPRWA